MNRLGSLCQRVTMLLFYIPFLKHKSSSHQRFQGVSARPNVIQEQRRSLEYPEKMHWPGKSA